MASFSFAIEISILILVFLSYLSREEISLPALPALPPGPSPWPLIGNLDQLGKHPHRSLRKALKEIWAVDVDEARLCSGPRCLLFTNGEGDIEKEGVEGENGIKATIFDMFLGGTETTNVTLEWAMSELLRNPKIAKKLQKEIESIIGKYLMVKESDLVNMEYLHCVVKETFQLYPAGPIMLPHEFRHMQHISRSIVQRIFKYGDYKFLHFP